MGFFSHDEFRMVVSYRKWTPLLDSCLFSKEKTVNPNYDSMHTFHAKIQTHITLLNQIFNALRDKLTEIHLGNQFHKRDILTRL